jgi:hypothetical protein
MEGQLPAGLSDSQRWVLREFFKGHISAGQLTQRLGIDVPTPAGDSPSSAQHARVHERHLEAPRRPASAANALRGRLAL